ncbi:MAG: hypothetical protein II890_02695 [Spirochaetia bacterium]|nr:hypothetical protein [Spirochaetia bacterium]
MKNLEKYIAECEKNGKSYDEINLAASPELTDLELSAGYFKYWRPVKKPITVRIDSDNLSWLQSRGIKGYQL